MKIAICITNATNPQDYEDADNLKSEYQTNLLARPFFFAIFEIVHIFS